VSPTTRSQRAIGDLSAYQLQRKLGSGGMGEVWLALRPPELPGPRACVIKKMLPHLAEDPSFVERFHDEAKVLVQLDHPNIAQTFEMGEAGDGEFFIAMEYVEGVPLAQLAAKLREKGRRLPLPLCLHVALKACEALSYAHRKTDSSGRPLRLVHRDISPANILLSRAGEVKIIDFGAAQSVVKESKTAPRVIIGNLAYMSPEQARKRPVDGRADLYSLCVVLWELLTWQPLPVPGEAAERWRRAAFPTFVSPSRHNPEVTPQLDALVMRGLSVDPRDRQQRAEDLRDELVRALGEAQVGPPHIAALMSELYPEGADLHPAGAPGATAPASLPQEEFAQLGDDDFASAQTLDAGPAAVKRPTPPKVEQPKRATPSKPQRRPFSDATIRDGEVPAAVKRPRPPDRDLADASGPSTIPDAQPWYRSTPALLVAVALGTLVLSVAIGLALMSLAGPAPVAP
jgi:serine/threonine protein kinase